MWDQVRKFWSMYMAMVTGMVQQWDGKTWEGEVIASWSFWGDERKWDIKNRTFQEYEHFILPISTRVKAESVSSGVIKRMDPIARKGDLSILIVCTFHVTFEASLSVHRQWGSDGLWEFWGKLRRYVMVYKGLISKKVSWPCYLPIWDLQPLIENENRLIDYDKGKQKPDTEQIMT